MDKGKTHRFVFVKTQILPQQNERGECGMNFFEELKKKLESGEIDSKTAMEEMVKEATESKRKDEEKPETESKPETDNSAEDKVSGKDALAQDKIPVSVPKYDRLEYDAPTDEQIEQRAKTELDEYKSVALDDIEEKSRVGKEKIIKAIEDADSSRKEKEEYVAQQYDKAREEIDNDMLRRGLARSSTAVLLGAENSNSKAKAINALHADIDSQIADLNRQIEQAEKDRLKAIDSFNIEYAVKYAEKVQKLKDERDKKQKEVTEYNNSMQSELYSDMLDGLKMWLQIKEQNRKDKEAEQEQESSKPETDAPPQKEEDKGEEKPSGGNAQGDKEEEKPNGGETNTAYTDAQLYEIFRNHLLSLTPAEAKNAIRNHVIYSENLTTLSYLKLLEEFGR